MDKKPSQNTREHKVITDRVQGIKKRLQEHHKTMSEVFTERQKDKFMKTHKEVPYYCSDGKPLTEEQYRAMAADLVDVRHHYRLGQL